MANRPGGRDRRDPRPDLSEVTKKSSSKKGNKLPSDRDILPNQVELVGLRTEIACSSRADNENSDDRKEVEKPQVNVQNGAQGSGEKSGKQSNVTRRCCLQSGCLPNEPKLTSLHGQNGTTASQTVLKFLLDKTNYLDPRNPPVGVKTTKAKNPAELADDIGDLPYVLTDDEPTTSVKASLKANPRLAIYVDPRNLLPRPKRDDDDKVKDKSSRQTEPPPEWKTPYPDHPISNFRPVFPPPIAPTYPRKRKQSFPLYSKREIDIRLPKSDPTRVYKPTLSFMAKINAEPTKSQAPGTTHRSRVAGHVHEPQPVSDPWVEQFVRPRMKEYIREILYPLKKYGNRPPNKPTPAPKTSTIPSKAPSNLPKPGIPKINVQVQTNSIQIPLASSSKVPEVTKVRKSTQGKPVQVPSKPPSLTHKPSEWKPPPPPVKAPKPFMEQSQGVQSSLKQSKPFVNPPIGNVDNISEKDEMIKPLEHPPIVHENEDSKINQQDKNPSIPSIQSQEQEIPQNDSSNPNAPFCKSCNGTLPKSLNRIEKQQLAALDKSIQEAKTRLQDDKDEMVGEESKILALERATLAQQNENVKRYNHMSQLFKVLNRQYDQLEEAEAAAQARYLEKLREDRGNGQRSWSAECLSPSAKARFTDCIQGNKHIENFVNNLVEDLMDVPIEDIDPKSFGARIDRILVQMDEFADWYDGLNTVHRTVSSPGILETESTWIGRQMEGENEDEEILETEETTEEQVSNDEEILTSETS